MMNKKQYEIMCQRLENAKLYDGRGTFDKYECRYCEKSIITTYKDKGVIPSAMQCKFCGCTMIHTQTYSFRNPAWRMVYNWIRPTFEQFSKLPLAIQEHVENGGLILNE